MTLCNKRTQYFDVAKNNKHRGGLSTAEVQTLSASLGTCTQNKLKLPKTYSKCTAKDLCAQKKSRPRTKEVE